MLSFSSLMAFFCAWVDIEFFNMNRAPFRKSVGTQYVEGEFWHWASSYLEETR